MSQMRVHTGGCVNNTVNPTKDAHSLTMTGQINFPQILDYLMRRNYISLTQTEKYETKLLTEMIRVDDFSENHVLSGFTGLPFNLGNN